MVEKLKNNTIYWTTCFDDAGGVLEENDDPVLFIETFRVIEVTEDNDFLYCTENRSKEDYSWASENMELFGSINNIYESPKEAIAEFLKDKFMTINFLIDNHETGTSTTIYFSPQKTINAEISKFLNGLDIEIK